MNKDELIETFKNWLNANTIEAIDCSAGFAEYKIDGFLNSEADGDTIFEDDQIVVGMYNYEYELQPKNSIDGNVHRFAFQAFGVGCKDNVTDNDYELADYTDGAFIVKECENLK